MDNNPPQPAMFPPPPAPDGASYEQPSPVWSPPAAPSPDPFVAAAPEPSQVPPPSMTPQPVVLVLSPRGVEYVFLTIALFTGAFSLGSALIALVNGKTDFAVLSVPVAALVVAVPVFAWLFLRLKKAEVLNPSLRFDASKRRSTQFTQIVAFLVSFFTLIGLIGSIFAKTAGQYTGSLFKLILDVVVVEIVALGILAYYWRDEHRSV